MQGSQVCVLSLTWVQEKHLSTVYFFFQINISTYSLIGLGAPQYSNGQMKSTSALSEQAGFTPIPNTEFYCILYIYKGICGVVENYDV